MPEDKTQPNIFPPSVQLEAMAIDGFETFEGLCQRIVHEVKRPQQSLISYLNVHVANQAYKTPRLKKILKEADTLYCDGAGIQLGAKIQGEKLPKRFPACDWIIPFFERMKDENLRVFIVGSAPGVSHDFAEFLNQTVPENTLIGHHHGYLNNDQNLENQVIDIINALKPDILIVGMGTPIQEYWIDDNKDRLQAKAFLPLGAVMDYFTGRINRCPQWMGDMGLEWAYRLYEEPKRLFKRYAIGNPWFISRMVAHRISSLVATPAGKSAASH